MPEVHVKRGSPLSDALEGHVASKTELRRLVMAGAVEENEGKTF